MSMKKIVFTICLLLIFTNCHNKKSFSQKASDKDEQNHLQVENLQGNVKEFLLKQAYPLVDSQTEFLESKVTASYIFNEVGNYEKVETFDEFEKLNIRNEYHYNDRGLLAEYNMRTFSGSENHKIHELNTYNEDNLLIHKKAIQDQDAFYEVFITYDKEKNSIKSKWVKEDGVVAKTEEIFLDDQDRVIKAIETSDKNATKNVLLNTYDAAGNLVLHEANINTLKFRIENSYNNGKRVEEKHFTIPPSEEVFLDAIINYDSNNNILKTSDYENSVLKTVFNYEYELDTQGNWIKKTTYINRNPESEEDFKLYLLETREITYW